VGIVAWEMLTGERPFQGPTAVTVGSRILAAELPSSLGARDRIPAHLDALVRRLLSRRPEDRPADMSAVIAALADMVPARSTRPPRRARSALLVAGFFALLGTVGMVGVVRMRPGTPAPPPSSALSEAQRDAERTYRAAIDALNSGDTSGYLGAFQDPMDCFFDTPGLALARLRERRGNVVSDKASRYLIDSIGHLPTRDGTVAFRDDGHIERPGRRFPHHKIIRMRHVDGRWRIAAEVDDAHHGCWPHIE
jgi:hypothetical protein